MISVENQLSDILYYIVSVLRAAMKMSNIDYCFNHMFTNPKDSQGVSQSWCVALHFCWLRTHKPMNGGWNKSLSSRRCLWQKTAWASFCTLVTSVQGPEAFQSTFCGRGAGMLRDLGWRWKDPVTSNWKISMQRRVSCLSLITVCASASRSEIDYVSCGWFMDDSFRAWPLWLTGEGGVDGDGDITRPENITAFRNFVLESTDKRGLHFLMADGVRLQNKNKSRGITL